MEDRRPTELQSMSNDETGEYRHQIRRHAVSEESEERGRSSDLGMLTIAKLALIIGLSGTGFLGINALQVNGQTKEVGKQIAELELRLSNKFAARSDVVDLNVYRSDMHEIQAEIAELKAQGAALKAISEAQSAETLRLRLERQAGGRSIP